MPALVLNTEKYIVLQYFIKLSVGKKKRSMCTVHNQYGSIIIYHLVIFVIVLDSKSGLDINNS